VGRSDRERLGEALARARQSAGWTQVEAAKRLGLSQSGLAKLETGRRRLAFLEAIALARAYGVSIMSFEQAIDASIEGFDPPASRQTQRRPGRPRRAAPALDAAGSN
jgi:transcriptional regulator with XRE-family HTH domain